jgi:periplasmic protein CpxP/Spy
MRRNLAPRVQAAVLLLLVAATGAVAGVVGDRLVTDRQDARAPDGRGPGALRPGGPPGGGPWRWEAQPDERYAERLGAMLELSPEQAAAIDDIVAEQHERVRELTQAVEPRFRAIAEETRNRIEDVMTAEQRERLRGLREQRMRMMRRGEWGGGELRPWQDSVRPRGPRWNDDRDDNEADTLRMHRERLRMGPPAGRGPLPPDTLDSDAAPAKPVPADAAPARALPGGAAPANPQLAAYTEPAA